jgi:hypothetical protein
MSPELPVIYENPRFDTATPTLWPVFNRAFRFGMVLMIEWGTLTLIEEAPRYLKVATLALAVLGLAVHESWPWLRMRDWRWYPSLMGVLALAFVGVLAYALATEPAKSGNQTAQSQAFGFAPLPPKAPRSKQTINELLVESGALLDLIEKTGIPLADKWRQSITNQNPEMACLKHSNDELKGKIAKLADEFAVAQTAMEAIFRNNKIDRGELIPLVGNPPILPYEFDSASKNLQQYRALIEKFGDDPSCGTVVEFDIPHAFLYMNRGLDQLGVWLGETLSRVNEYRNSLRKELRNAQ